ncbi:uncharacterized protein F4807DRAFT_404991 [Annulohypoxylon truncatum]|uniref:uncharacterized protein n=1 Tax=Annulohypoxylon truncatum TaxID=327061 RepID=UPI0020079986|nr:uncharacterized protein F4807DRAFT_404991 [Annulohypoxylon truncatum]KAI1214900.1 hypothetical protein F4807DRAFT_404991 [Annulohypoxylon truncatum]
MHHDMSFRHTLVSGCTPWPLLRALKSRSPMLVYDLHIFIARIGVLSKSADNTAEEKVARNLFMCKASSQANYVASGLDISASVIRQVENPAEYHFARARRLHMSTSRYTGDCYRSRVICIPDQFHANIGREITLLPENLSRLFNRGGTSFVDHNLLFSRSEPRSPLLPIRCGLRAIPFKSPGLRRNSCRVSHKRSNRMKICETLLQQWYRIWVSLSGTLVHDMA